MIRGEHLTRCPHCNQTIEGDIMYITSHILACSDIMRGQQESIKKDNENNEIKK